MYYLCRPIDSNKERIELRIVDKTPKLGQIAEVYPEDDNTFVNPVEAAEAALKLKSQWERDNKKDISIAVWNCKGSELEFLLKTKFASKLLKWANHEFLSLPKCNRCRGIRSEQGYRNRFQSNDVFCSESCANGDLEEQIDSMNDNEETEFFLE